MRRLWAHIMLAVSTLLIVGATFPSIFSQVKSNYEYTDAREYVYRLTDKVNQEEEIPAEDTEAAKSIAKIMAERLNTVGITSYKISTSGNDLVKVTFADSDEVNRNNLVAYLGFNGSLGLSNIDDNEKAENYYYQITGEQFLLSNSNKRTYLSDVNGYPTIVIPVNVDHPEYQVLIENTNKQHENSIGESSQDSEGQTTVTTYLYLWYDFNEETDRYSRTIPESEDYDVNIANKIIMKFNIENLYYPDDENNKLSAAINVDADGDGVATIKEVRDAYNNARFYVNLLNSSELDYTVTYINTTDTTYIKPWTEAIVSNGDYTQGLAWSRTLIATLCAIVIISLLLVVFFKLSALAIGTCSILSTYTAACMMVVLGCELNIAAIVGILLVAVGSLACGIIYATKLKEEAYKGRSLKKANTEAGKKSMLPTVDINVVVAIMGVFAYVFGGTYMRGFGFITVVGAIFCLLINLIGLRGLMWLATNTTGLTGKYGIFGIDADKVPSLVNEEKQSYFGPYAEKDFTSKKKPVGIVTLVLLVAAIAGLATFGSLNNGNPFNQSYDAPYSEVYVTTSTENGDLTNPDIIKDQILSKTYVYTTKDAQEATCLKDLVLSDKSYSYTKTVEKVDTTYNFVVFSVSSALTGEEKAYFGDKTVSYDTLNQLFEGEIQGFDSNASAKLRQTNAYDTSHANFGGIMLGTGVAILVLGLYFMLRYRLSRGITSIILPAVSTTITAGFFSLIRAYLSVNSSIIIPFVAAFTFIITVMLMNKEREMIIDERSKGLNLDSRKALSIRATSLSFSPIIIFSILMAYLGINYFGIGPSNTSLIFVMILIGILFGALIVTTLYSPIACWLYKRFSNIHLEDNDKKKRKKKKVQQHSNEPEEAVFIGIND